MEGHGYTGVEAPGDDPRGFFASFQSEAPSGDQGQQIALGGLLRPVILFLLGCLLAQIATATADLFGLLTSMLAPVPLAWVFVKHGVGRGIQAASLAVLALIGMSQIVLISGQEILSLRLLVMGITFGLFYSWGFATSRILILGASILSGFVIAEFLASPEGRLPALATAWIEGRDRAAKSVGTNPDGVPATPGVDLPDPDAKARSALNELLKAPGSTGMDYQQESVRWRVVWLMQCPLFLFASLALILYAGYMACLRSVLRIMREPYYFEPFTAWSIPWWYAWIVIGAVIPTVWIMNQGDSWWSALFVQVTGVALLPYAVVTFSIANHVLEAWDSPPFFRYLVNALVLLFILYLAVFTLVDSWVDFRRLSFSWPDEDEDEF